jgi:hypothetical protein
MMMMMMPLFWPQITFIHHTSALSSTESYRNLNKKCCINKVFALERMKWITKHWARNTQEAKWWYIEMGMGAFSYTVSCWQLLWECIQLKSKQRTLVLVVFTLEYIRGSIASPKWNVSYLKAFTGCYRHISGNLVISLLQNIL